MRRGAARGLWVWMVAAALAACAEGHRDTSKSPPPPPPPVAFDAPADAPPVDAPPDAPPVDAPPDAPPDAPSDAPSDAPADAPGDAPSDGPDAPNSPDGGLPDAPGDAPVDGPAPAEDTCTTAKNITAQAGAGGVVLNATTVGYNNDDYASCNVSSGDGADRVYRLDLAAGDIVTVVATPQDDELDIVLSLVNGCGTGESCYAQVDSGFSGDEELMASQIATAGTYYLYVDSYYGGSSGPYQLIAIISHPTPLSP